MNENFGWFSEGVEDDVVDERVVERPPAVEKSRMLEVMGRGDPSALEDMAAALSDEAAIGDSIDESDGPGKEADRIEGVEGAPPWRWKFVWLPSMSSGLPTPMLQPPPNATDPAGFLDGSTTPLIEDDPNPKLPLPSPPGADDDDPPPSPCPGFIVSALAILLSGKPKPKSNFRTGLPEVVDVDPDEALACGPEEDDVGAEDDLSSFLALNPSDLFTRTSFSDSVLASESLESTMGLGSAIPWNCFLMAMRWSMYCWKVWARLMMALSSSSFWIFFMKVVLTPRRAFS